MNMPANIQNITEANKALNRTKVALMSARNSVFFTTILFSLHLKWDSSLPTAGVDGISLFINPDFFMGLTPEEREFLILHEVGHVIFDHITRRGTRDRLIWNYAGDYVINEMLVTRGYKIIEGALYDRQFQGLSTEQVYDLLIQNPNMCPSSNSLGEDILGVTGSGEGSSTELKEHIKDVLIRAALQSQIGGDAPGTIPGQVQIYLDKLLNPKLPWHVLLRRFFNDFIKDDYSWRKPNRRFFPEHHLPSLYSEGLGHIALAVDTSASVSDVEFTRFISEAASIFKSHKPKTMTVIQFDTNLKSVDTVSSPQTLQSLKFTGRGGTSIKPVFNWINENKPQAMLIFTDGCFRIPPEVKTSCPIIWLIHDNPNFTIDTGKVVHYEV